MVLSQVQSQPDNSSQSLVLPLGPSLAFDTQTHTHVVFSMLRVVKTVPFLCAVFTFTRVDAAPKNRPAPKLDLPRLTPEQVRRV